MWDRVNRGGTRYRPDSRGHSTYTSTPRVNRGGWGLAFARHRPDPRGHSPHSSTPRGLCRIGLTKEKRHSKIEMSF